MPSHESGQPSFAEGERVLGPPQGTYDAAWVAAAARQSDPGLPEETAQLLATQAWAQLRAGDSKDDSPDAPGLARALFAANPDVGASAANVVATAALDFCAQYAVER